MADPETNPIPFGKYKGEILGEIVSRDRQYLEYLIGQSWLDMHAGGPWNGRSDVEAVVFPEGDEPLPDGVTPQELLINLVAAPLLLSVKRGHIVEGSPIGSPHRTPERLWILAAHRSLLIPLMDASPEWPPPPLRKLRQWGGAAQVAVG